MFKESEFNWKTHCFSILTFRLQPFKNIQPGSLDPPGIELTDDLLCFTDGVGDDQQSGLRCSHVPQHERLGFSVEAGNVLSLQLLTQVSAFDRPRVKHPLVLAARW